MLGLKMLQATNFPTSMGKSLLIDTINCTSPLWGVGQNWGCLSQPRGVFPLFNCSSTASEVFFSVSEIIFSKMFWFQ